MVAKIVPDGSLEACMNVSMEGFGILPAISLAVPQTHYFLNKGKSDTSVASDN